MRCVIVVFYSESMRLKIEITDYILCSHFHSFSVDKSRFTRVSPAKKKTILQILSQAFPNFILNKKLVNLF